MKYTGNLRDIVFKNEFAFEAPTVEAAIEYMLLFTTAQQLIHPHKVAVVDFQADDGKRYTTACSECSRACMWDHFQETITHFDRGQAFVASAVRIATTEFSGKSDAFALQL